MPKTLLIPLLSICLLCATVSVRAAGSAIDKVLPVPACAEGWVMDGKVALFDKDNLFERINGEAELYFPYGFELLASARYAYRKNPQLAFDADVYKMGSLLDAFGVYANYRRRENADVTIGAEGTVSESQLFFYQDRYLVRLQATGSLSPGQEIFLACGRAIARNLPGNAGRPSELDVFAIPAVERKSERYSASSLLGYDFFHRGLMADALLNGQRVQLFLVIEDTRKAANTAFEQYRVYLTTEGKELQVSELPDRVSLQAVDPLYGRVVVEQTGRFIIGAVRVTDAAAARQLVEQLRMRVGWIAL
jgi:hypothetical protein